MTPNINQDSIICGNDVSKQNKSINITKDKYNLSNITWVKLHAQIRFLP